MKPWLALMLLAASPAGAFEIGESDFRYVSDLAAEGFTPFPASGVGNSVFGMRREAEMYLCFIADTSEAQGQRQTTLLAEMAGDTPDPSLPNIPVVCILTQ